MTLSIPPRVHDLGGGFTVKRLLPHAKARTVGPFVFFDHIGPAELGPDQGLQPFQPGHRRHAVILPLDPAAPTAATREAIPSPDGFAKPSAGSPRAL